MLKNSLIDQEILERWSGLKLICRHAGFPYPWKDVHDFRKDVKESFVRYRNSHSPRRAPFLALKDPALPFGRDNWRWSATQTRYLTPSASWGTFIEVGGQRKNLSGWARYLGLTRERARQLHAAGRLVERIETYTQTHQKQG